jgi:hypothetical protein
MFPTKALLTLLTVWLFATVCLAEDPPSSFPQPEKDVVEELLKDQYIVQYNGADDFQEAKNSILDGDEEVEVVRYIDTSNIGVYKFSSQNAAAEWRDGAVGVKYFFPLGAPDGYDNEYGHGLVDAEAVYEALLTPSVLCPTGTTAKVEISTDWAPWDTSWDIRDADGNYIAGRNNFQFPLASYIDWVCLPETETCGGTDYIFKIYDSYYANGICCEEGFGYYEVTIDDKIYAEGGRFTNAAATSLCTCPTGTIEAKVEVLTDYFQDQTSWDIKDANDIVVASRGSFDRIHNYYTDTACLVETETCFGGTDYTFTIYDSYGDGLCCDGGYHVENGHYRVLIEGETYAEGGNFDFSESTTMCKDSSTSCVPYSGTVSECSRPDSGCFWYDGSCHDCSAISDAGWGALVCEQKGCFWDSDSLSCE